MTTAQLQALAREYELAETQEHRSAILATVREREGKEVAQ